MPAHDPNHDSHTIASAMACKWLAAYHADDPNAGELLQALKADPRGLALAFGALADLFVSTLNKLDQDGAIEGGVQLWLDRLAMNLGAAADSVVSRYRGEAGQ
jgi:hypothetical protein